MIKIILHFIHSYVIGHDFRYDVVLHSANLRRCNGCKMVWVWVDGIDVGSGFFVKGLWVDVTGRA